MTPDNHRIVSILLNAFFLATLVVMLVNGQGPTGEDIGQMMFLILALAAPASSLYYLLRHTK